MKKTIRRLLVLLFALTLTLGAQAANETETARESLLPRTETYDAQFADVDVNGWYYPYVAASYEYSLFNGRNVGFAPNEDITVAELLTLSARIRALYSSETIPDRIQGESWYMPYVHYLADKGLVDVSEMVYSAPATRAQLAGIFAAALPEECFDGKNADLVAEAYASGRFITDVDENTPCQSQILWLFREGLSTGVDGTGSYWPDKTTSRAEAAAIVVRMVDPSLRLTPEWDLAPVQTAAGMTLSSLVGAPETVTHAPDLDDLDAIDALARQMLAEGKSTIHLNYPSVLTRSEAKTLASHFTSRVKSYCEQMYNSVICQLWSNGAVDLIFSATACSDEELVRYREETMAKALEAHNTLWASGQISKGMSQYEKARACFLWLCDNCTYDWDGMYDDCSPSHIAYNALVNGAAVCDGYTGAYNLLLKLEGIDCYAMHNDAHMWTVATLDGRTYHIDTTWGDQAGKASLEYFGMTEQESYKLHLW